MEILDIHSHRLPPYPLGVISVQDLSSELDASQLYSVGIHPWGGKPTEDELKALETICRRSSVVAIGECGVDLVKSGMTLADQLLLFRRHFEISEELGKPLTIHCVKGADIILGLHRDFRPTQKWMIHGFRGKPATARQFLDRGISLSLGPKFNADTATEIGRGRLLVETDDSEVDIMDVIGSLAAVMEVGAEELRSAVAANSRKFLGL